jgi:DNA-3-methyladenine glycosylase
LTGLLLPREFFAGDARAVARALLGKLLVRSDGRVARLVEVEAYLGLDDPASHAFRGPTPRAKIMFGPPGILYVYFSYGVHWCANVVCGPEGTASAVLLRAAQPLEGIPAMRAARWHGQRELRQRDLCRGPGRLCEALGITGAENGLDLTETGGGLLGLADDGSGSGGEVVATLRVGLTRGASSPWRFIVKGSPWVSAGPREVVEEPAPGTVEDGKAKIGGKAKSAGEAGAGKSGAGKSGAGKSGAGKSGAGKSGAVKVAKVVKVSKAGIAGAGAGAGAGVRVPAKRGVTRT